MNDSAVVLLLPGMTLNRTIFPDLRLPAIGLNFNRLALGRNGDSALIRRLGMGLYVRLLEDWLAQNEVWAAATERLVVGHSFGGMLAIRWLTDRPEVQSSISGLVLIGASPGPLPQQVSLRLGSLGDREIRLRLEHLLWLWNRPTLTRIVKHFFDPRSVNREVDFRLLTNQSDFAVDLAGWLETDWRAMRCYRSALWGFDVRHRLNRIRVRTAVIHGAKDSLLPSSGAGVLAKGIPGATLSVVSDGAHILPLTHGALVADTVYSLLSRDSA